MPSYAAFIGHQPNISLAELAASVPGFLLHDIVDRNVVLFDSAATLDGAFLDTLGGTVILAEKSPIEKIDLDDIPNMLAKQLMNVKGKAIFSIRSTGLPPGKIKELYRKTKDVLKKKGKPSRYVGSEKAAAPSIVLRQSELLDVEKGQGCEMCIVKDEDLLWVGFTRGAQDIESYTNRDMKKPVRDTTVGLLPPKLAQILINFGVWLVKKGSQQKKELPTTHYPLLTIYDPFCGTGVIPMECLLRGFPVLASDKAEKAVSGCTKNLEWMRKQYEIKKSDVPSKVWKQDATKPFDVKEAVDVIVTESSLGPGLQSRPTVKDVQKLKSENEKLQSEFLASAAAAFPKTPIVCIWPVWYTSKTPIFLEKVWEAADKAGYEPILPPSVEFAGGRLSLLYRRPDQFVGREIVLLRPKR